VPAQRTGIAQPACAGKDESERCTGAGASVCTPHVATPTSPQIVGREQRGSVELSVVLRSALKFAETRSPVQIRAVAAASWLQKVCCFEGSLAIPAVTARASLCDAGSDLPRAKATLRSAKPRLHARYQQPKRRKVGAGRTQRSDPVNRVTICGRCSP
jgi:hypothetical protein